MLLMMNRMSAILAGLLLSAPASSFAAGVQVRSVPVARNTQAPVGIVAAYAKAGRSMAYTSMPLISLAFTNSHMSGYVPTLAGVAAAVRAYTLKLRANVVRTFDVGAVDTATWMPTGEVAEALKTLQMPVHEKQIPESIRFIERRGSVMRPASESDTGSLDTESSYLAEGGAASSAKGQLSLIHHREKALGDNVDPSGIGRRIEGTVSFDGGRHSGVSLN